MHLPFDRHLALVRVADLLAGRIRPAIADPELEDLLDAAIGLVRRLAIEDGHPGVLPAASAVESNRRAALIVAARAQRTESLIAAIDAEIPELLCREGARAQLDAPRPDAQVAMPSGLAKRVIGIRQR